MNRWIVRFTQNIEYWAAANPLVYWLIALYYRDIIRREVRLAEIGPRDHILCVGGGPCPFSAILLHQYTGARVTVIDRDENCILPARRVLERLNLSHVIQVLCHDCSDVELEDFTVVHLAVQVSPLEQVLRRMRYQALPGTRLLVRTPKAKLQRLYGGCGACIDGTDCRAVCHRRTRNIDRTLLFVTEGAFSC